MHYNGRGVPRDYIKAYIWCSLAGTRGHSAGKNYLSLIKSKMKPAEIKQAQAEATKFQQKNK
ncbi:MAG: hypothetical protein JRC87_01810 [Deltaproteobacteria bacterium]|nr:hypothetical protein [Deltaproteobacteria bacterium]